MRQGSGKEQNPQEKELEIVPPPGSRVFGGKKELRV